MAKRIWRAVVTLNKVSGVPEDAVQNTFHFEQPTDAIAFNPTSLTTPLANFYNLNPGGSAAHTVASFLSETISRVGSAHQIDYYLVPNVQGPVGNPVASSTWTLGAADVAADKPMPDEVCACLSLDATDLGTGTQVESVPGGAPGPAGDTRPASRHRGRLFIGPLNDMASTAVADSSAVPRVGGNLCRALVESALDLSVAVAALASPAIWSVFSRTEWDTFTIRRTWVDDAFDIQRRRGPAATTRVALDIPATGDDVIANP